METTEMKPMSLEELQSYHQAEVNRIQEELDQEKVDSKEYDKLVREKNEHLNFVQHYADEIESGKRRKDDEFNRLTTDTTRMTHERKMKKWDVLGKIAAIATGVGLTYGLEKLLNCMPNRNADKFIPRA